MSLKESKGSLRKWAQKDANKSDLKVTDKSEDSKFWSAPTYTYHKAEKWTEPDTSKKEHSDVKTMAFDEVLNPQIPIPPYGMISDLKATDKYENAPYKNKYQNEPVSSSFNDYIPFHFTSSKAEKCTDPDSSEKQHSDAIKVQHCDPCIKGQNLIQAHGFCINCSEYLCKFCFNSHKNYKAFKNHSLQGHDEMPTDAELITIEDQCLKHEGKPLEYFCKSCDELACTVCMFKQHRSCENVDYIPDIAGNLEESDEYKQLTEDIQCLEKKFTDCGKTMDASLKTSEYSRDRALAKIKEEADEVKKILDRLTTKMNDEVHKRFTKEQEKLTCIKEKNTEHSQQLKSAHNRIKYSKKARQLNKLFISVKKERKAVDDLEKELLKLRKDNCIQSFTFKASKSVENFKILSELGDLFDEKSLIYDTGSDSIEPNVSDPHHSHYYQRHMYEGYNEVNMNKESGYYDVQMSGQTLPEENIILSIKDHEIGKSEKVQHVTDSYNEPKNADIRIGPSTVALPMSKKSRRQVKNDKKKRGSDLTLTIHDFMPEHD